MNGILKSLATVSGMTMLSRVLGFVRQILIAGVIGAGGNPVADAFWAAFRLPNMFRRLFAEGAFHAAFIPLFQGKRVEDGEAAAREFAEQTLSVVVFLLCLLTALVELAAPLFVYGLATGFVDDPEKFELTTFYARIMFPYLLMMSVVGLLSGLLNSLGRFAVAAAAPLSLNIMMIGGLLIFADAPPPQTGQALSWAVFAGGLVQLVILLVGAARSGYLLKLRWPRLTPSVKRLLMLGAPGFLAAGAMQINLIIGTNIASREPGAVSWLMNADQLYQLPLAVIGIALGVVMLPLLAARIKEGDEQGAAAALNRAVELSALLVFPASVAFVIVGIPICDALFRGLAGDALALVGVHKSAFTVDDAVQTGMALALFGLGLPAFVWQKVCSPAFFAREDTKTPMYYALASIAINTVVAIWLFQLIGFLAVPLATSLAAWVQLVLLVVTLYRRGGFQPDLRLFSKLIRIALATAVLGGCLSIAARYTDPIAALFWGKSWLAVLAYCGGGLLVYIATAMAVGALHLSDYKGTSRS